MDYTQLDPSELRIAVAGRLGWRHNGPRFGAWIKPNDSSGEEYLRDAIPDFPNDLNACHEFERETLFPKPGLSPAEANVIWAKWDRYVEALSKMVGSEDAVFADAKTRCVAFLMATEEKK